MKTPFLYQTHERAGARMGEFAGWRLPIDYGSTMREVMAVRRAAGLFDVSHMGRLEIRGKRALASLQTVLTNDVERLGDGAGLYTLMCNRGGGIKDDLIVFRKAADLYGLVVNASNLDKDRGWILDHLEEDARLVDCTPETVLFALQGPKSAELMEVAGMPEAAQTGRFHFTSGQVAGSDVVASRTGYTGEDGFEITCRSGDAERVWAALLAAGRPHGLMPCGLAARDVLRTEAGLALYGHEISEETTPVEAGLMRWVKLDKGDFIGSGAVAATVERGPARKLVGIEMEGRAVPRPGNLVRAPAGEGRVTSGTFSPTLGRGIAIAYLPPEAAVGETVQVWVHDNPRPGLVRKLPLYSRKTA